MKKIILVLLIVLIALPCWAKLDIRPFVGGVEAGGDCDTVVFSNTGDITGDGDISDENDMAILAQSYNEASQHVPCKLTATLTYKTGDITGVDFYMIIATRTGDNLDLPPVATSDSVTGNNSWSASEVPFEFSSPPTLSASTDYFLAIWMDSNQNGVLEDSDDYAAAGEGYTEWEYNVNGEIPGNHYSFLYTGVYVSSGSLDMKLIMYE